MSNALKLGGAIVGGALVGALGVYAYKRMTAPAGQVFIRGNGAQFPYGSAVGVLPGGQVFIDRSLSPQGLAFAK